jgi:hypothetical protein
MIASNLCNFSARSRLVASFSAEACAIAAAAAAAAAVAASAAAAGTFLDDALVDPAEAAEIE